MDSRFIESLLSVVETGSIVAAARAQSLTPPATSQRIQVLERELGVLLLERTANAATPTRACLDLLDDMRRIVTLTHALQRSASPGIAEGTLRLGAISTMLTGIVPGLLRTLRQSAPGISLDITPGSSQALYDALLGGELDAALIVAPEQPAPDRLVLHGVRREPLVLLAPEGEDAASPQALFARHRHIAYDPRSWGGKIAQRYLDDHAIAARRLCALDGLEAILEMVRQGAGVSVVPAWPGLQGARPLADGALYARSIVAAIPSRSERPACINALLEALRTLCADPA